ncbi:RNA-binding cell elongation regulator Jag/EloR [Limosilactobacillus antri]|nr:RNA-binding cell elongation regulator Jag/EloR [Limosilactobacillus antri]
MVVYTGKTVKDAVQQASRSLHRPEAALKVEILEQPRRGFLGIGRRPAKIEATIKPPKAVPAPQPAESAPAAQPTAAPVQQPAAMVVHPHHPLENGDEQDPAVVKARHEANVRHTRNAGQQLTAYLKKVFADLGIETEPQLSQVGAHAITVNIKTASSGRVIGRHGSRINALEQISAAFMNYHGAPKTSVVLDTSNYRQRRREALHQIAERAATEVVASGKAVFLDPMPARERKQLHKELENDDHVRTYSHGREPYRSVVIAPKN